MTIESIISSQTMLANGVVRSWPFTFRVWEGQVQVLVTDAADNVTDVTAQSGIAFNSNMNGGVATYPKVTTEPALPSGYKLTVSRDMDFLQNTDLVTGSRYLSEVMETRLDRMTAQDQELLEGLNRAVKVPIGSDQSPDDLRVDLFNARDEAVESAAQSAASATQAGVHEDWAHKWADNPENVVVKNGEYSAFHWAKKSGKSAQDSAASAVDAAEAAADTVSQAEALLQGYVDDAATQAGNAAASAVDADESAAEAEQYYNAMTGLVGGMPRKMIAADNSAFVNPGTAGAKDVYTCAETFMTLPVPPSAGLCALVLNNSTSVNLAISAYVAGQWVWDNAGSLAISDWYIFHVDVNVISAEGDGVYWFANSWNTIDAVVKIMTATTAGIGLPDGETIEMVPGGAPGMSRAFNS